MDPTVCPNTTTTTTTPTNSQELFVTCFQWHDNSSALHDNNLPSSAPHDNNLPSSASHDNNLPSSAPHDNNLPSSASHDSAVQLVWWGASRGVQYGNCSWCDEVHHEGCTMASAAGAMRCITRGALWTLGQSPQPSWHWSPVCMQQAALEMLLWLHYWLFLAAQRPSRTRLLYPLNYLTLTNNWFVLFAFNIGKYFPQKMFTQNKSVLTAFTTK